MEIKHTQSSLLPGSPLKHIISLNAPFLGRQFLIILVLLLLSGLQIWEIEAFRRMIDAAAAQDIPGLVLNFLIVLSLVAGCGLIGFFASWRGIVVDYTSIIHIQKLLAGKLFRIKLLVLGKYHSGDITSRINNAVFETQTGVNNQLRNVLLNIFTIIFAFVYLGVLNLKLVLFSLCFVLIIPFSLNLLSGKLRRIHYACQEERSRKDSFVKDSVQGMEVIKSYCREERFTELASDRNMKILNLKKQAALYEGMIENLQNVILVLADLVIIGYSAFLFTRGEVTIGEILSFLVLTEKLIEPVSALTSVWPGLQRALAGASRFLEILDLPETKITCENPEPEKAAGRAPGCSALSVVNLSFCYTPGKDVLREISLDFPAGSKTAICGRSGQGKSTFAKLLLRFYEPAGGEICWKGRSIFSYPVPQWNECIAYVPQEPLLFSCTIYENIAMGNSRAYEEDVIRLAERMGIDAFIKKKEKGYHTPAGTAGANLSGGERQRITLARALLKNPEILILDEPTSHLDNETEFWINDVICRLMKDKIVIAISHKASFLKQMDKVFELDKGILKEKWL